MDASKRPKILDRAVTAAAPHGQNFFFKHNGSSSKAMLVRNPLTSFVLLAGMLFSAGVWAQPALILNTEEYPPMNFTDPGTGKIIGIGTDIVRETMRRANIDYEMRMLPWKRAYGSALRNRNECVFSTSHTDDRDRLFAWVEPLSMREWVIFARQDSNIIINGFDDIRPYVVGGYAGDAKSIYLESQGIDVENAIRDELNPVKLKMGRIPLWAADRNMGHILARQAGVAIKPLFTFKKIYMSLACNRATDGDLLQRMVDAIEQIHEDGTARRIETGYTDIDARRMVESTPNGSP